MRAVIQRIKRASVRVEGQIVGKADQGLLVLIAVTQTDTEKDMQYLVDKTIGLRIFEDEEGKMNRSVQDIGGEILVVSQFTLYGDVRKGRRPSFTKSAPPEMADQLYLDYVQKLMDAGLSVEKGIFGADMEVELVNDGPVTILLDSEKIF
ncbi:MAG: D-aminoacyl-tRNA deacylase [Tissierellia bacterium]|nr:D-aminoacyl-tRNA deacylase [Tissierellia bacterium]